VGPAGESRQVDELFDERLNSGDRRGHGYRRGGAGIEQAKGMLMLIYGMDEAAAFELLKWRSQETNVKLRLLAAQVAADFLALTGSEQLPPRAGYEQLLLTAHLGITADYPVTIDVAATEDQECHPRSKAPDNHGHAGNHRRDHIRQI
jgi:ANTAR domain